MANVQVIVFAGTTEGRRLGETLAAAGIGVLLCVATDYGEALVEERPGLQVHTRRMDAAEMAVLFQAVGCSLVVDATHPYAQEVTENVRSACADTAAEYIRLVRSGSIPEDAMTARNALEAAQILAREGGSALLTVGSKELAAFTAVPDFQHRLYARVLPTTEVLGKCAEWGFSGRQLFAMQGPFGHLINVAMIRELGVDWLVTKDSGETGGFPEKVSAAKETGARLLVIRRPVEEEGFTYSQVIGMLLERLQPREDEAPEDGAVYPRFPLFVDLTGRSAVIVGGGNVAMRRTYALLQCGAAVSVIAPEVGDALGELARGGQIVWYQRQYADGDLEQLDAMLAVAATDDAAANRRVEAEARRLEVPCSVADDHRRGSFWFPAFIQYKNLVAGLVSSDQDHGSVRKAAELIRKDMGEIL